MNMFTRITAALVFGALLHTAPVAAQTPNPLAFTGTLNPAVGKWFVPNSNFGGITLDINYDTGRPVVFGEWQFQEGGEAKVVFYQTELEYRDNEDFLDTGIFATLDSPTFTFTGRGDYGDPYTGNSTAVLTGRNIRVEFHSSRTATFIDNPGQPDERRWEIVGTLRGLPLVAPTDYSGEWLFAGRLATTNGGGQAVARLTLTPYSVGTTQVIDGNGDYSAVLPEPGARAYLVTCESLASSENNFTACEQVVDYYSTIGCATGSPPNEGGCFANPPPVLLWVNPDETGYFASVDRSPTGTIFYTSYKRPVKIVADTNTITLRSFTPALFSTPTSLKEGAFYRLPTGLLPNPF